MRATRTDPGTLYAPLGANLEEPSVVLPLALAVVRGLQLRDVQPDHLQHRVGDTLRAHRVLVAHHFVHEGRDDLPAHAVPVFQPPACLGLAALEQRVPVAIELGLVVTSDHQRDRVIERVERPGTHCLEALAKEREVHDLHGTRRTAGRITEQWRHPVDARVGEDGRVERRRLLGLFRVPEERKDLRASLHTHMRASFSSTRARNRPLRATHLRSSSADPPHRKRLSELCLSLGPTWRRKIIGHSGTVCDAGGYEAAADRRRRCCAYTRAMIRDALSRLVCAGLVTAMVDGLFSSALAVFAYRSTVTRLWQGVASVPLGPAAFEGGARTTLVGLLLHGGVAFGWSAVFLALYLSWPQIRRAVASFGGVIAVAALYGPAIWLVMSLVVIPLLSR